MTWAASSRTSPRSGRRRSSWTWSWATTTGASCPCTTTSRREFMVCDRWFCSVPGATWPNRLYALLRPGGREQGRRARPGLRRPLVRSPSRDEQGLVALVLARRRHAPLHRLEVPARLSGQVRVLRPAELPRAAELPRRREGREAAGRVLDRPELRGRVLHRALGLERRPSALGHQGRAGARAQDVHGARATARTGGRRCSSSPTTSTAASSTTCPRRPRTTTGRRSAPTACACPSIVVSPFTPRGSVSTRDLRPHVGDQDDPAPLLPEERADPGHGGASRERESSRFDAVALAGAAADARCRRTGTQSTASPRGAPRSSGAGSSCSRPANRPTRRS